MINVLELDRVLHDVDAILVDDMCSNCSQKLEAIIKIREIRSQLKGCSSHLFTRQEVNNEAIQRVEQVGDDVMGNFSKIFSGLMSGLTSEPAADNLSTECPCCRQERPVSPPSTDFPFPSDNE